MVTAVHPGWDTCLSMVAIAHVLVAYVGRQLNARIDNIDSKQYINIMIARKAVFLYKTKCLISSLYVCMVKMNLQLQSFRPASSDLL